MQETSSSPLRPTKPLRARNAPRSAISCFAGPVRGLKRTTCYWTSMLLPAIPTCKIYLVIKCWICIKRIYDKDWPLVTNRKVRIVLLERQDYIELDEVFGWHVRRVIVQGRDLQLGSLRSNGFQNGSGQQSLESVDAFSPGVVTLAVRQEAPPAWPYRTRPICRHWYW